MLRTARRDGAQLEGSKAFTKEFLDAPPDPDGGLRTFTDFAAARDYVATPHAADRHQGRRARGRQGRDHRADAERRPKLTLDRVLRQRQFGAAGATVVIEDFLDGEEASFIAIVDGTRVVPLASSQDHKTRDDGDRGPNTGGMGAYSPAPVVTREVHDRVMREIMLPTVRGLAADGIHYRGFLYAGLMIDAAGQPRVIEFNCRLGDPETQPIVFRLRSDLVDVCLAAASTARSATKPLEWDPRATVGVVMASRGYPDTYEKGQADPRPRASDGRRREGLSRRHASRRRQRRDRRRPRALRRRRRHSVRAARDALTTPCAKSLGTAPSGAPTSATARCSAKRGALSSVPALTRMAVPGRGTRR